MTGIVSNITSESTRHANGVYDGYVARINADGSLAWTSYLGGTGWDGGQAIAIDRNGNAWVAGRSNSPLFTSGGSVIGGYSGYNDIFVAKIETDLPMPARVSIAANTSTVLEGNAVTYTITRTGGEQSQGLDVIFLLSGSATFDNDFTIQGNDLVYVGPNSSGDRRYRQAILANSSSATFSVNTVDDSNHEEDETLVVELVTSNRYIVDTFGAVVTIADATPVVSVEASDSTVAEGNAITYAVTRTGGDQSHPLTVYLNPPTGTATAGDDYGMVPTSVTILANQSFAIFSVNIVQDSIYEPDEMLVVGLAASTTNAYTFGASSATVTIQENDALVFANICDAAREWNSTSPAWSQDYQCAEQANALKNYLFQNVYMGHWDARVIERSWGIIYHNAVHFSNGKGVYVIDAFKGYWLYGQDVNPDGLIQVYTLEEFKRMWPNTNDPAAVGIYQ